ncbi:MAG: dynamin family protein, partial [Planktothrix sp.]
MNKSEEIQSIIAQRQPLAKKLADIETGLSSLYAAIQRLEQERDRQLQHWAGDDATQSKLQKLNFASFQQNLMEHLASLGRLQKRFSRKTLNIGVIGRMRQGKSTLLQSLTGLKNEVIPARPGKPCTAARSTISHKLGNLTTAEIQFHDRDSFLQEIIIPYYQKLGLTPIPSSFEAFAHSGLPSLPPGAYQTDINIYNRLKDDYHTHAQTYQEYLGRGSLTTQDESQISKYVASQYSQNDQLIINHECLAVKQVKISCPFPFDEIGAIALVDVPGLGDFRLGDESLVIEALGQEVDFILFIRKPSNDGAAFEQSDTQLYDLANKALNDLPSRSMFVLNADGNGKNQESCRSMKRDIDLGTVEIPVLDCVIADCSSPEEANSKVLQVVLNNLRSNVTQLDRKYAEQKIADLQASFIELKQQLQLAEGILPHINTYEIEAQYDDLFEDFW